MELQEIQKDIFDKDSVEMIISDKIIKVRLKNQSSKILFIHVEVQSYSSEEEAFIGFGINLDINTKIDQK